MLCLAGKISDRIPGVEREAAPAGPLAVFQYADVVTRLAQFVGRRHAPEAGPQHQDAVALGGL